MVTLHHFLKTVEAALSAQETLVNCDRTTPESWKQVGSEGLMLLARRFVIFSNVLEFF